MVRANAVYEDGIDVVVVSRRTADDLRRFLASVTASPPRGGYSVSVVNVEPEDRDMATAGVWLRDVLGPADTAVVNVADNIGYNRACNLAAAIGRRAVIALFNADVELTSGALDECFEALIADPSYGILGPRQVDHAGRVTAAGIFGPVTAPAHRCWKGQDRPEFEAVRDDAVIVLGSAMFIRRSLWTELDTCPAYRAFAPDAAGPMLECRHYFGDTWLSRHVLGHGKKTVYYGPVRIVHEAHGADPKCSYGRHHWDDDKALFRAACDAHGLDHE